MKSIIMKTLAYASNGGFSSLALPAMGTGNLQYPPRLVAKTMFETVLQYSQENPNASLRDIRFVLYDKDQAVVTVCITFFK